MSTPSIYSNRAAHINTVNNPDKPEEPSPSTSRMHSPPRNQQPHHPRPRKRAADHNAELLELACKRLRQPESLELTLAKNWANELSKMGQPAATLLQEGD